MRQYTDPRSWLWNHSQLVYTVDSENVTMTATNSAPTDVQRRRLTVMMRCSLRGKHLLALCSVVRLGLGIHGAPYQELFADHIDEPLIDPAPGRVFGSA